MSLGTGAWKVNREQKPYAEGEVSMATLEAGTTKKKTFLQVLGEWRDPRTGWPGTSNPQIHPKHLAPHKQKREKEQHTPDHADVHLILRAKTLKALWSGSKTRALRGEAGDQQSLSQRWAKWHKNREGYLAGGQVRCASGQMAWQ